uniref:Uncharacterized protein n=1 Tax=Anguilla anguilla TaxID=7936 RepID=A0A0E9W8A7_ANGAN
MVISWEKPQTTGHFCNEGEEEVLHFNEGFFAFHTSFLLLLSTESTFLWAQ